MIITRILAFLHRNDHRLTSLSVTIASLQLFMHPSNSQERQTLQPAWASFAFFSSFFSASYTLSRAMACDVRLLMLVFQLRRALLNVFQRLIQFTMVKPVINL